MSILLDFIPFQILGGVGGAASFTKAVYDEFFRRKPAEVRVLAAYDATLPVEGRYDCHKIAEAWGITLIDISTQTLVEVIRREAVNTFFIAIGQFYSRFDLKGIDCKTIMFIHDIFDVERCDNRIDLILSDKQHESRWKRAKRWINLLSGRWDRRKEETYQHIMPLFTAEKTIPYTVSAYSKSALEYYFPQCKNKVRICYSPLNEKGCEVGGIQNPQLSSLIEKGKPFLLMLAANRIYKNAALLMKVFTRLQNEYPDLHLLTLKYGKSISDRHIDINYLSDSDLEIAYQHAYILVFASFFEGFGYPPIEAARYGTPTVASNVTSIPEILGNAGVYFSPFYPSDLYHAIKIMMEKRDLYVEAAQKRYQEVLKRQQEDLERLIIEILT